MSGLANKSAIAAAAVLLSASVAFAQEEVGQATLIKTAVTGAGGALAIRSPVYRDERITTSQSGLGEFTFRDGTKFAVGGNSSVIIDHFVFDDAKSFNQLTLNAARGSFRWISGKSKSEAYQIVTPAGTLACAARGSTSSSARAESPPSFCWRALRSFATPMAARNCDAAAMWWWRRPAAVSAIRPGSTAVYSRR